MAVVSHAILLPELLQEATEQIHSTYDGPLTIASDLFVWNVTKDKITVRRRLAKRDGAVRGA
jgi:ribonuclease Z